MNCALTGPLKWLTTLPWKKIVIIPSLQTNPLRHDRHGGHINRLNIVHGNWLVDLKVVIWNITSMFRTSTYQNWVIDV